MSVGFVSLGATKTFAAVNAVTVNVPAGVAHNDQLLAIFGFEGVAAGSGPWIDHTDELGWSRLLYQAPSAAGSGLEIWQAILDFGTITTFRFGAAQSGVAREVCYRCSDGGLNALLHQSTQQVVGDNPTTPSITTTTPGCKVCLVVADQQTGPGGYGVPGGYVQEFDNTRAGFGTVEIALFDTDQPLAGPNGTQTLACTASPAGAAGATAAFDIVCASALVLGSLPLLMVG